MMSSNYVKIYFNLKEYLRRLTTTYPQIMKNNGVNLNGYADFVNSDRVVVLSSLKFKKTDNYEQEVASWFKTKFGKGWDVFVNYVEHSDDSYIGICIEKK